MRPIRIAFSAFLLSFCLLPPASSLADINEQFDATCRITAPNMKGGKSGIVYTAPAVQFAPPIAMWP